MLDATLCIMMLPSYLYPFGMTARQADQDFGRSIADIERAERTDHLRFFAPHDIGQCRVLDQARDDVDDLAASGLHCAQGASDLIDCNRYRQIGRLKPALAAADHPGRDHRGVRCGTQPVAASLCKSKLKVRLCIAAGRFG